MGPSHEEIDERIDALMNRANEHLDKYEYEEALAAAHELEELQYTGAYEIAALAHQGKGDVEEAVRVLHRGVEAAPDCWLIWELLGNYLSDLERYEEAEAAYEEALLCDEAWEDSIRLNRAILAQRRKHSSKAFALFSQVGDPDLAIRVAEGRVALLFEMGKTDEAAALAEETLANETPAADPGNGEDGRSLARIAALLGQMRLAAGEDKEELSELAWTWLTADPLNEQILKLIRDLDGKFAERVRYYGLLLHASIPRSHPLAADGLGYFVNYTVVAENPQEALEFVRRFEDDELAPLLEIEDIEFEEEFDSSEPKGVWYRSPMQLYETEE